MGFSGISLGSLLMIGFVGLLTFGPEQLKKIARELGESLGELKKGLENGQSTQQIQNKETHSNSSFSSQSDQSSTEEKKEKTCTTENL